MGAGVVARGPLQADACPICGLVYARFRGLRLSFAEAYLEVFAESVALAAAGRYDRPASRRAVLGRLHEYKRGAWREHIERCAEAADFAEVPF